MFLPREFTQEPGLVIPGRKPVGPVEIDWNHPMTKGLRSFVLFGDSFCTHGVKEPSVNDYMGWNVVTPTGTGMEFDTLDIFKLATPRVIDANDTVLLIRRPVDTTDRNSCAFGTRRTPDNERIQALVPWSNGTVYFDYGGTAGNNRTSWAGYSKNTDVLDFWAFSGGTGGNRIWYNGQVRAEHTTSISKTTTEDDVYPLLINDGDGANGDKQIVYMFAWWSGDDAFLTESELQSLYRDPYQFLIPRRR